MLSKYTAIAIERSRDDALEWLESSGDGYPRSWEDLAARDERKGYVMYDDYDFEAPPIAGYEALESEGLVTRLEATDRGRIHFRLVKSSG